MAMLGNDGAFKKMKAPSLELRRFDV